MPDFEIIAEGKLSGSATEIDITSIPATFTHLECVFALRAATGAASGNGTIRLNGDSGSNYGHCGGYTSSGGSGGFATRTGGLTYFQAGVTLAQAGGPAGIFYVNRVIIPLYASTTTSTKTIMSMQTIGWNNADNFTEYCAGFWNSTSAVSSVTLGNLGANYDTNSSWWVGGYA